MPVRQNKMKINRSNAGILLVVFGTLFYLIPYTLLFVLDDYTSLCIVDRVAQEPINKDSLIKCVTDGHDTKLLMFDIGVITSILIVIGNVLVSTNRKNQLSSK